MQKQYKLYLACRNSTNPHIKGYYKRYSNILSKVITEAKKHHYDKLKILLTRIKQHGAQETKETQSTNIKFLNIDGITTDNQQRIAETFNNYFTSIAENIKTTDRNAYIQYKNTPDTAIIDISSEYVNAMKKLRCN